MNPRRPPSPRSGALPSARRRAVAGLAAVAATAVLLAGCTVEPPAPAPEAPVVAAVVGEPQERKILDRVSEVIEGAGRADAAGSLGSRLAGPALEMREAELDLAEARGDTNQLAGLTMEMQQVVLPSEQGWPRSSYGFGEQPEGRDAPVLVAFEQAAPREQYKLWGYVQLLPGVTLPRFATAELGSPAVAADDTSLKASPQTAVEQYASVLTDDGESRYAGSFADDDLRRLVRDNGRLQVEAIEDEDGEGSFEQVSEPARFPVKAVRTADGGALVLAAVASQETIRAEEHWLIGPRTASAQALWGDADQTNVVKIAYRDMVALYVPPKESDSRISLLGFHRVPYAVSNE